ncbi:hypothetical protein MUB04_16050 [Acinetobacter indicus]|uniref:hypothetical protein n=1 Tax=Acinetobacter TaxID=469 RepID=UPI0015D1DE96|nr:MULTISPECIES: hypothetical protein [Acinetobacter]MCP0918052.1 hypothetical protein [Acinetobacter indicus]
MLDDSKKTIEVEITDLITGLPFIIGESDVQEFDGLSHAARVESIKFDDILIMNTKITDRSHLDLKGLCQLFLDHDAKEAGFQFNAVLVAYLLNTAITADQAYNFIKEKMKVEAKETDLSQHKISLASLFKKLHPTESDMSGLITSTMGGYKYIFATTH